MRKYKFAYSHKSIVGERVVTAVDSCAAFKAVSCYLDARFGKRNWTMHECRFHSKPKNLKRADGSPTIQRVWNEPPTLKVSNYKAMEKYGAWQYKN